MIRFKLLFATTLGTMCIGLVYAAITIISHEASAVQHQIPYSTIEASRIIKLDDVKTLENRADVLESQQKTIMESMKRIAEKSDGR